MKSMYEKNVYGVMLGVVCRLLDGSQK